MDPLQPQVEPFSIGFHKGRLGRRIAIYAASALLSLAGMFWLSPDTLYYSRLVHDWRPLGAAGYWVLMVCLSLFLLIGLLGLVRIGLLASRRHGIAITGQGLVDNSRVKRRVTEWPLIASVTPCTLGYRERGFSPRPVKGVELQVYPLMPDGSRGLPYSQKIGLGMLDVDTDRLVSLIQQAKAADEALRMTLAQPASIPAAPDFRH
jgi:hypothetical protein